MKTLTLFSTLIAVGVMSHAVNAAEVDVDATVTFRPAITTGTVTEMDFGIIDADSTFTTDKPNVSLAAVDGALDCGSSSLTCGTNGTPGAAEVTGAYNGSTVSVSCETSGLLSNGSTSIQLGSVEVAMPGAASATPCAGLGLSAGTFVFNGSAETVQLGGTLLMSTYAGGGIPSGEFSTDQTGGAPVSVNFIYQ